MSALRATRGGKTVEFQLTNGGVTVGTAKECQIVVADPAGAPRHCQIVKSPKGFVVIDRSGNPGTFVNGKKIQDHLLKEGDILLELDGQKVVRQAQVQSVMGNKYAGDTLVAVVKRGDETIRAEMTLTDKLVPYESAYLGILPSRTLGGTGVPVRFVFADSPAAKPFYESAGASPFKRFWYGWDDISSLSS